MKKSALTLISLSLAVLGLTVFHDSSALAVSGTDWNPGRIIDDVVFQNKNSMTVQQIQQFLDAKVPVCDRNGTTMMWDSAYGDTVSRATFSARRGISTPFTCLKEYVENPTTKENNVGRPTATIPGGIGAAQLIYNAAQAQNINPQVYLVLLQKEQSLITDDWPWPKQFERATGNNCPDTAPCDPQYAWLWTQVNNAGAQFNYYVNNFDEYNYAPGWNNILYSPNGSCGTRSVFIENAFTAALYIYTPYTPNQAALSNLYGTGDGCSSYGNRNFWRMFSDWFGGTYTNSTNCDARVNDTLCVWSLRKSDGSQFLTTSKSELINAIISYGWVNEGISFYASQSQRTGMVPVYRLRLASRHFYTSDQSDYTEKITTGGWADEGVLFYAYPPTLSSNAAHKIYKLYNPTTDLYYLTNDNAKKNSLISAGYIIDLDSFNTISGLATLPLPSTGRSNVYVLRNGSRYIHTSSITELDNAIKLGYIYERVLSTFNSAVLGTPVYRLQTRNGYFYTTNISEKTLATQTFGMTDEGIVYYLDESSNSIYRLYNSNQNRYYYSDSIGEVMQMVNTSGWRFEGSLLNKTSGTFPVLRYLNMVSGRHFYTINMYEGAKITNTHWKYEGISFSANNSTGLPIYRLRIKDKYFFTINESEKNTAVNSYGYSYEGVAFYASPTNTESPVYRLQGLNDEYFYTRSITEKDLAISRYGYTYEGIGFYSIVP